MSQAPERRPGPPSFDEPGYVIVIARVDRRAGFVVSVSAIGRQRAASWVMRTGIHSRACGGTRPFDGPYNNQMEPSRLTVCAIMRPRPAAHLAR